MKFSVLVADDDDDDVLLLANYIKAYQPNVLLTHVEDGLRATQALIDGMQPDLIIVDAQMPTMNGNEFLSWLRSNPTLRYIPVVVWTGSSSEQDIMNLYRIGASSVVAKWETLQSMQTFCQYWFDLVRLPSPVTSAQ